MHEFGVAAEWTNFDTISVKPQQYTRRTYTIENDWTASSYWYEILALQDDLDAEVVISGLKMVHAKEMQLFDTSSHCWV